MIEFLPIAQAGGAAAPGGFNPMFVMMGVVFLLLYVIVLRPNNQEKKKREELLNSVAKGDQVVTIGGIHGTVEGVDISAGVVSVSVAPKVTLRINKAAVASVTKGKGGKGAKEEDSKAE